MRWSPKAGAVAVVLLTALGLLVAGHVGAKAPGSAAPDLFSEAEAMGLRVHDSIAGPLAIEADSTGDPSRTLYVIGEAERPYDDSEVAAFTRFLARGGKALLFDGFGHSSDLIRPFGVALERVRLVDPAGGNITVEDGTKSWSVALASPSAAHLLPGTEARVVGWSSPGAFLDRDGDGLVSQQEPEGRFPVVVEVAAGHAGGHLVIVADGGLAASSPEGSQNSAWRKSVMGRLLPEGGDVVRDRSGDGTSGGLGELVGASLRLTLSEPWRSLLLAAGGLAALAMAFRVSHSLWRSHRFRPDRYVPRDRVAHELSPARGEAPVDQVERWTSRGVVAMASAVALLVGGLAWGNAQATLAAMVLATALVFAAVPPRVRATASRRIAFQEVQEGAEVPVEVELRPAGRGRVQIMDRLSDEMEIREGTNEAAVTFGRSVVKMEYVAVPAVSGPYTIGPLLARTQDPLSLRFRLEPLAGPEGLRVFPRDERLSKLPHNARVPAIIMGLHQVNKAGGGTEFHALREYQTGDPMRSVNWKASARTKELMVNQRIHESRTDLTVLLDARAISAAGPVSWSPIAQGRRVAISIFSAALRARDRVRLLSYGHGVTLAPATHGMEQVHVINRYLADLLPGGDTNLLEAVEGALNDLKPGFPLVLVSGLEADPSVTDAVSLLRSRNINPILVALDLGTDSPDAQAETGVDAVQAERQRVVGHLRSIGVPVYESDRQVPLDHVFRLGVLS